MNHKSFNQGSIFQIGIFRYILTGFPMNDKDYALLVSLFNGNRFSEPLEVVDRFDVSERIMDALTEGRDWEFIGPANGVLPAPNPEVSDTTQADSSTTDH